MKRSMTFLLCLGLAFVALRTAQAAAPAAPVKAAGQTSAAPAAAAATVDSIALLEKAVARDSTRFDDLYRLGVMYLDRDKPSDATRVLARARSLRPKDHKVLVNLGVAYDAIGQAHAAQESYKAALAEVPDDPIAMCRLASSLYSQTRYPEAVTLLTDVIRKTPSAYCAYFTMGVAFADAGIYRDAIRMWRRVVELAPTSPEAVSARESIEVLEKFVSQ